MEDSQEVQDDCAPKALVDLTELDDEAGRDKAGRPPRCSHHCDARDALLAGVRASATPP